MSYYGQFSSDAQNSWETWLQSLNPKPATPSKPVTPAPVTPPPATNVIVGNAPKYNAPDPTSFISQTTGNDSGYGPGFSAPVAAVPATPGISSVMKMAIVLLLLSAFLWVKHLRKHRS